MSERTESSEGSVAENPAEILREIREASRRPGPKKPNPVYETKRIPVLTFTSHRKVLGRFIVSIKRSLFTLFWKTLGEEMLAREADMRRSLEEHAHYIEALLASTERLNRTTSRLRGDMDAGLWEGPSDRGSLPPLALDRSSLRKYHEILRGDDAYLSRLASEHLAFFSGFNPVLDIGCGRGVFLSLLKAQGIEGWGIDIDSAEVETCIEKGLRAEVAEACAHLVGLDPGSLGGICCSHVIEHLSETTLLDVLLLSFDRLRPGGRLFIESPDPSTLMVLSQDFYQDISHVRPVHPQGLMTLLAALGFTGLELIHQEPFSQDQRLQEPPQEAPKALKDLVGRLNDILYGPRAYAVKAKKPHHAER